MTKLKLFFTRFLVVLLALQGILATQALTATKAFAATTPSIIINEIMWPGSYSGTVSHTTDEWIEFLNTTKNNIDLTGWKLSGVGASTFTIGLDGTLTGSPIVPAGGYFLVSHFDNTSPSTILAVTPDWLLPAMTIYNSCQPITFASPDESITDTAGCGAGGAYFAGLNDSVNHVRKSMERVDTLNADSTISAGDGTLGGSWLTANDHGNISDKIHNFASPKLFNNDLTAPTSGAVTTGAAWATDKTTLTASWDGFADPETGIDHYLTGYGTNAVPTSADIAALQDVGNVSSQTLTSLNLIEGTTYYFYVQAVNPVGLASDVAVSSGVTITHPTAPVTNLTATDVPGDNGGDVQLSWTASADADHYLVGYLKVGADVSTTQSVVTANTSLVIKGLENAPASYQFNVFAVAANALPSTDISVIGLAIDNLLPLGATLTSLQASCQTLSCRVELRWQPNDPSVTYYQIGYRVNGVEARTINITGTSAVLDLPTGQAYTFAVYSFDAAGNESAASNQLAVTLAASEKIIATYQNGQQLTTITSLAAPKAVVRTAAATSSFVPAVVSSTEPVVAPVIDSNASVSTSSSADNSTNNDWIRLVAIVIVLLLIALGFYGLSRTLRDDETKPKNRASKKIDSSATKKAAVVIEKRKRGRPKGTTKKPPAPPGPKRGRGRPKGSLNKKKKV